MLKKNQPVRGKTVAGRKIKGIIAAIDSTASGRWVRVQLADGLIVSTRPSLLKAA